MDVHFCAVLKHSEGTNYVREFVSEDKGIHQSGVESGVCKEGLKGQTQEKDWEMVGNSATAKSKGRVSVDFFACQLVPW